MDKRRKLPTGVRKKQLLNAARKILTQKGYSLARISDIVKEAGVSQGTFYLYFSGKEDVVIELGRELIDKAMHEISATCDPENEAMEVTLKGVISAYYRTCLQYEDVIISADAGGSSGLNPLKWNEVYDPLNKYATRLISIWRSRGDIDAGVDDVLASWLLIDTINGSMTRLLGRSGARVSQDYENQVGAWTLAALKGYRP